MPRSEDSLIGKRLSIPVPGCLTEAFGYIGDARFVGFCWRLSNHQLLYSDGKSLGLGFSDAFLVYRQHWLVCPLLSIFPLGASEEESSDWLVVDREHGQASLMPDGLANEFLKTQHKLQNRSVEAMPQMVHRNAKTMLESQMLIAQMLRELDEADGKFF